MEACCCSSSSSILTVRAIDVTRLSPLRCSSLTLFQPAAFRSGFLHLSSNHFFIRRASPCSSFRQRWKPSVFAVFERFTERAIRAVVLAQREAKGLGKELVSPQHLLLGLIAEDRSMDGFLGSGITVGRARDAVRGIWSDEPAADEGHPSGSGTTNIPFSVSSKRVFEAAVEFSRSTACNFIAPEHIAVGLFTTDDGSSGLLLKRLGADANKLTSAALLRLQGELAKDGRETSKVASKMLQKSPTGKAARVQSSDKSKDKSMMFQFCVDVTSLANEGRIDPVIGRDIEIQRVVQILCRRTKNSPILLGDPGVGKTAIAEGLALQISCGNIPLFLVGKRIMSLDVGLLMAGSKERGELEARVKGLIAEVRKAGDVILFIDEVHTLVWSGTAGKGNKGSGLDISNLLKPTLGRGELQCIASTTLDEYRAHFERDKALARRFQPVFINEPSQEDAVRILMGLREKYESHHKCRYTLEAINAAVYFSARYIPDRHLPDKAIDLIDEAGSKARMNVFRRMKEEQTSILSKSPEEYWQEIEAVQSMHQMVLENKQNFMSTRSNSDINELTRSIIDARESIAPSSVSDEVPAIVGAEEIASVASLWSGIPLKQLSADEMKLLFGLDEELRKRVLGQDDAINAISRAVKRSRLGLKDPDRPIAAMLFCGPTGVGKTELTKALAASYFGSESEMVRLDMSEYMERHSVSKLIGSPPGYLGYGEGGALTEAVRRRPFTVILLDEIEKAHPDIFSILLQVFEDGRLTDSQGRRVSFKNALIIMTSNAGSASISRGGRCAPGFMLAESNSSYSAMKSLVMEELRAYFRPELLNRIDEVVVFRPLEKDQMREILNVMLKEVKRRMASLGMALEVSESVKELVCQQGFERSYGARPLRRALTRLVEDVVSEAILAGDYKPGDTIFMDLSASGAPVLSHLADTATTPTPI